MRNVAAVIVIALLIPAAYAADVEVVRPRIAFLSDTGVAAACKGVNRRGCTTLMTEFVCACVHTEEDNWTLKTRFIVTPYVYTTGANIMLHELEHVADVRASLNEYASTLALRTFVSESSCASFVVDEKKQFGTTMRNIQRLTTVKRDGVQYAHRAGDH
jgi:hypothetical protein